MASKYFKSLLYLLGFGSTGYILLELSQPSEETIKQIRSINANQTEQDKQKTLFLNKLKASANLEPSQK